MQQKLPPPDGAPTLFGASVSLSADFAHPQPLAAEQGAGGDNFGFSVSLSADRPTALVGAPATDALKGAAYVFNGQLAPFAQDGRQLMSKYSGKE
jgi:hypothetical protein